MSVYFEPPPVPDAALAALDRTVTNEPWSDYLFAYYVDNLEAPEVRRSMSALVPPRFQ